MDSSESNAVDFKPELCLNIWLFVVEGTDWCNQIAVRAYCLKGDDVHKGCILRDLAAFDFINVPWYSLPERYVLVNPNGEQMTGWSTLRSLRESPHLLEYAIHCVQCDFPQKNFIVTDESEKPFGATIGREPYYCETVLVQTRDGKVRPVL